MSSARRIFRSPVAWTLTVLVVAGLAVTLALFQPWRLFTNTTVVEAVPTVSSAPGGAQPPPEPKTLARGEFISHEHGTSGTAVILQLADGSRVLRLENLDTSDGPDLHVWLAAAPVLPGKSGWFVFGDAAHVDLGSLKGNKGSQNYAIPSDADLAKLTGATIWCQRFHVSFGAAQLK
ncbi:MULTISPECIES: DM13 domain-containing protein [unclassified Nocardia]|uniref:DM13 domain-containing protein n=1 Tax=unclassified Nocardia TaxID=2637762 RepID=UPI001CE4B193|nr:MULTISPECIES: DM13 domain-containing protein [unclassified Nocardia]